MPIAQKRIFPGDPILELIRIICQVLAEKSSILFTWSEGPDSFEPYQLTVFALKRFRDETREVWKTLRDLVLLYNGAEGADASEILFSLANHGYSLHEHIFGPALSQQICNWMADAHRHDEIESLEIRVDAKSSLARHSLSIPWNIVYGVPPNKAVFAAGDPADDQLRHFWGRAHNLAIGIRADPLRRKPRLDNPRIVFAIDTATEGKMLPAAQAKLRDFIAERGALKANTREELSNRLCTQAEIIYWFSHTNPESLYLDDDKLSILDLYDILHQPIGPSRGGIAFLNACQTAEVYAGDQAYLNAVTDCGMSGIVGTEQQTIDYYANELMPATTLRRQCQLPCRARSSLALLPCRTVIRCPLQTLCSRPCGCTMRQHRRNLPRSTTQTATLAIRKIRLSCLMARPALESAPRPWRLATSLQRLREQVDALAPLCSVRSDGSIGNAAHASRNSDYNPWVEVGDKGVVTASDITNDPANGCDVARLAESLREARDPRVKYVIWNRRIFSATVQPWQWRFYDGNNSHDHHMHISVQAEHGRFDDDTDWNVSV